MKTRLSIGILVALLAWLVPGAVGATTTTFTIDDGGIDGGAICQFGFQCTGLSSHDFQYDPPPPDNFDAAMGTITVDDVAQTIDLSFSVSSFTMLDVSGPVGGVDEVVFTTVSYTATGLTYSVVNGNYVVDSGQSITISGTYEQLLGGANVSGPSAFSTSARIAGNAGVCLDSGTSLVCGFIFGPGQTTISIGTAGNRKMTNVFNVVATPTAPTPEPGSLLLLGTAVLGLAYHLRRRL